MIISIHANQSWEPMMNAQSKTSAAYLLGFASLLIASSAFAVDTDLEPSLMKIGGVILVDTGRMMKEGYISPENMMKQGEMIVNEGQAMKEVGRTLKSKELKNKGDTMIDEGRKIRKTGTSKEDMNDQGQNLIREGEKMIKMAE